MTIFHSSSDLVRAVAVGAARGLNVAAERVRDTTLPLTPLEYGDLRSSIVVGEATPDDLRSQVGSDLPYAVPQHERLDYRHKQGQAKFLESATRREQGNVGPIIAEQARRAVEG